MDDSNVRGCWKAVCLNQNTAIDHLFPSNLLPDDDIISYGAKSAVGTFRTYGTGLMMSADWSEEDNTSLRRYFRV